MTTAPRPADILIAAGITFTKLHRWNESYLDKRGKRVELGKAPIGDAWQTKPYTAKEARRHYKDGYNVGTHAGQLSNGVIWADVDDGRFAEFCLLDSRFQDDPIVSYRDNAPGRGKIAIRVTDVIPSPKKFKHDPKDKSPFFEVLSTGNQAAIIGTHPSGVPYRLRGSKLVTMTRAELDAIVSAWTGQTLDDTPAKRTKRHEAPQAPAYTPSDPGSLVEQVKAAWSILGILQRFGLASHGTEEARNGETRVLGNGGLLVTKDGQLWSIPANGKGYGGNVFHAWYWAKHQRLVDFQTDKAAFVETLHEMATAAGIEIPKSSGVVDPEEVRAEVAALRAWVKSVSFADFVPAELQCAAGYRTDSTDTRIADAYLDIADSRGTWRFMVSNRTIAEKAGVSAGSVPAARRRLAEWFLTFHDDGAISVSDVARRLITSSSVATEKDILINLRATYSERKADDVFLSGTSRTKRAQAAEEALQRGVKSVGQVVHHDTRRVIVDDLPLVDGSIVGNPFTPEQMVENRYDERILTPTQVVLREYLAGLGETILRIVDAIEVHGDLTRAELAESTGKTKGAIARATLRAERLGLLCSYRDNKKAPKVYALNPDWADSVETLRPLLKTHRLGLERRETNLTALIDYLKRGMKRADEEGKQRLSRRLGKAEKHHADVVAELRSGVDVDKWVSTPNASNARFDYSPIMQQQRADRWFSDTEILTELIQPGRMLWRDELAKARTAAGRLGVNYADYVDTVPLEMAAA